MDIYLLLYLFLIAAPFSTIIHELGHLVGATIVKADQITLSIGTGKNAYTFSKDNIRISFQPSFLLTGLTKSERSKPYNSLEVAFITFCGPLFNILSFILFTGLHNFVHENSYFFLLMLLNGWIATVNMVPFKVNNKESDGYIIFKQLFKNE
ncbi:hypothetical protein GMD78_02260 [Ornithinibacillus sp. L9]|uniref:Peptidase M50 domain-containing protein n=1 Tax=Ornithinibacillus caprae TaxID=2678566 RepID=A0A6N8FG29_9BACI|nr:site-2 protease family protein [Ornithinibacillus caprae]MUK87224.1 hypothetical protein [Ornithinibacillus caprae]